MKNTQTKKDILNSTKKEIRVLNKSMLVHWSDKDVEKYLERSEQKWSSYINLSGKSSLKKNKKARRVKKVKSQLMTTLSLFLPMIFIVYIIWSIVWTNVQLDTLKVNLLEDVSAHYEIPEQDSYTEDEISEIVDEIQEFAQEVEGVPNESEWELYTDDQIIDLAFDFIKDLEWMHLTAYWDVKRYSIWCGTISYEGETITIEEARSRCHNYIGGKLLQINRVADGLEWNKKVALLSFMHNTGYNYRVLMYAARGDDASVIYIMSQYVMAWWEYMKGLNKRRQIEIAKYNG